MEITGRFAFSDVLGECLLQAINKDIAIMPSINLNDYLPSLQGPTPIKRNTRQSRRTIIDPDAISRDSISAVRRQQLLRVSETKQIHEKDLLIAKQSELETKIDQNNKIIREKEQLIIQLERQIADMRSRSRIGSRSGAFSQVDDNGGYWKSQYEGILSQYQSLVKALEQQGNVTRVSGTAAHVIRPTKPTFADLP